jgi:hypothetical protein
MPNNVDTPPFTRGLYLFTRQVAQEMLSGLPRLSGRPVGINQNYTITSSSVN